MLLINIKAIDCKELKNCEKKDKIVQSVAAQQYELGARLTDKKLSLFRISKIRKIISKINRKKNFRIWFW